MSNNERFEDCLERIAELRERIASQLRRDVDEFADTMFAGDTKKTLEYLFPSEVKEIALKARPRTVEPKYRNPENPLEVWSGRGRVPRWMERLMKEKGMKKEDFLIRHG